MAEVNNQSTATVQQQANNAVKNHSSSKRISTITKVAVACLLLLSAFAIVHLFTPMLYRSLDQTVSLGTIGAVKVLVLVYGSAIAVLALLVTTIVARNFGHKQQNIAPQPADNALLVETEEMSEILNVLRSQEHEVAQLTQKLSQLQNPEEAEKIAQLSNTLEQYCTELRESRRIIGSLQARLAQEQEKSSQIEELRKELELAENSAQSVPGLKEDLRRLQEEHATQKRLAQMARTELDQERAKLAQQTRNYTTDRSALQAQSLAAQAEVAAISEKITDLEVQMSQNNPNTPAALQATLEQARRDQTAKTLEAQKLTQVLKDQELRFTQETEALQKASAKKTQEVTELEALSSSQLLSVQQLTSQLESSEAQVQEVSRLRNDLREARTNLEKRQILEASLEDLSRQFDEQLQKTNKLEDDLREFELKNLKLQNELAYTKGENRILASKAEELALAKDNEKSKHTSTIERLSEQLAQAEQARAALKEELDMYQKEAAAEAELMRSAETALDDLGRENQNLSSELEEREHQISELERSDFKLREENTDLSQKNQSLTRSLIETEQLVVDLEGLVQRQRSDKEKQRLKLSLSGAEARITVLARTLEDLKSQNTHLSDELLATRFVTTEIEFENKKLKTQLLQKQLKKLEAKKAISRLSEALSEDKPGLLGADTLSWISDHEARSKIYLRAGSTPSLESFANQGSPTTNPPVLERANSGEDDFSIDAAVSLLPDDSSVQTSTTLSSEEELERSQLNGNYPSKAPTSILRRKSDSDTRTTMSGEKKR